MPITTFERRVCNVCGLTTETELLPALKTDGSLAITVKSGKDRREKVTSFICQGCASALRSEFARLDAATTTTTAPKEEAAT